VSGVRDWIGDHRGAVAVVAGAVLPLAVSWLLVPFRATFADAAAALVLVAVVTLVAIAGSRPAGYVAAISASLWFDFFLTRPYDEVVINRRPDIEITVSLLIVGIVVTELAARTRLHHERAEEEASYVDLLYQVSELVVAGRPFDEVLALVRSALSELLYLRDCRFELGPGQKPSRELRRDGGVLLGGMEWPVSTWGLPGKELALPIMDHGRVVGRMMLVPTPGQPVSLQRRLVAVALSDQLGPLVRPRLRVA
jgi:K+-sensing histidine kinase KdpD